MNTGLLLVITLLGAVAATLGALYIASRRETARLRREGAETAERERDTAGRLMQAETRAAAAEQAVGAERELRTRSEEQLRTLTAEHGRTETELAALRASSAAEIAALRQRIPDIVLTSDIIVGFPGETYEEFRETVSLVQQANFTSMYTFIFSPREGSSLR